VAALSIEDAVASGAQIISMSFVGLSSPNLEGAIATALRHGVIVVAGLPNGDGKDVGDSPGTNNGVVSVLSGASDGSLQIASLSGLPNTNPYVDVVAPGVNILEQGGGTSKDWTRQSWSYGTSWATPIVAAELALDMQKYPKATPNQILQSMIHNTGITGVSHSPERDSTFGYGTVVADTLLAADPTQYPDVNPFIDTTIPDGSPNGPSVAEIAGKTTPTPAATSTPTPTPGVTPTTSGTTITGSSNLAPLLIVAGIVLLLIIIAAIVIIVIVAARKQGKGPNHG
jgi:subtilisin family serine protease